MIIYQQNTQKRRGEIVKLDELSKIVEELNVYGGKADVESVKRVLTELGYDFGNVYQELEMRSRFVDSHQDVSYANDKLNLHSHDFYEVLYCRSNSSIQYLVGTQRYRLQRGDIVFVPPGMGHRPILEAEMAEPYYREVLWISTEFMREIVSLFDDTEMLHWEKEHHLVRTEGTRWERLGDYFHAGVREAEQRAWGWQAALCGNTTQLLVMMGRALKDRGNMMPGAEKPELLDEVVNYIEANLSEKIVLAEVAKRFWVSESTISQTFRQKMDVSFHHFVTQRRLIAAKSMILEGQPMDKVSERVGFADYSTFYRAFKHEYGISPRQYRSLAQ